MPFPPDYLGFWYGCKHTMGYKSFEYGVIVGNHKSCVMGLVKKIGAYLFIVEFGNRILKHKICDIDASQIFDDEKGEIL